MTSFQMVLVPLLAAAALCALPAGRFARAVAVLAGLLEGVLVVAQAVARGPGGIPTERFEWAGPLAHYAVGADGFGLVLLALTGILFAAGAAASRRVAHPRGYFALWCLAQAAVSGVFIAQDLVLFFVFWEAMLIPVALLMWLWGGADARGATLRFLLYTMAGSALLLAGIVSLVVVRGTSELSALALRPLPEADQTLVALVFVAAFAVKLPLFPFHAWLPRAYVAAPPPVAAVLSGIVAKTAAYGVIHLCLPLFPAGMARLAPGLVALAAVGTLYGALLATRQHDTRRIIAFSSLSHLNLIGLGVFTATAAASQGALVASVSHGLVVVALFLLATLLAQRVGGWSLADAGGVAASAPVLSAFTTLAVVAAIGVPGTSGFAGEFLILAAAYARFPGAAVVAALVVVVAAVYGLRLIRHAFHGPARAQIRDLGGADRLILAPLLALILLVGVVPTLVSDRVAGPPATPASAGAPR